MNGITKYGSVTSQKLKPYQVTGNVLSLVARQSNAGQAATLSSGGSTQTVFSDMSDVRNSYAYSNAVSNGDFSGGTTGWATDNSISVTNSILTATGTGSYAHTNVYKTSVLTVGRKYYLRAFITIADKTNLSNVNLGDAIQSFKNILAASITNGVETLFSGVATSSHQTIEIRATYSSTSTASGKAMQVRQVMVIDLTSLGLDTLSAAQCDALFPFTAITNSATTPVSVVKYNTWDWMQWTKSAGVVVNSSGAEYTANGSSAESIYIATALKTSTKYVLFLNVLSNTISTPALSLEDYIITPSTVFISALQVGYVKFIFTTTASIGTNRLKLNVLSGTTVGQKIKIKDIRIFELFSGSTVESDFTNKIETELNTLYPMGVNEAVSNSRANDVLLMNPNSTSASGFNRMPVVSGKGMAVTYTNLVTNGDFSDGTTGWTTANSSITASSNTLYVSATGLTTTFDATYTVADAVVVGNRWLVLVKAKVNDSICASISTRAIGSTGGSSSAITTLSSPINGAWNWLSGIYIGDISHTGNLKIIIRFSYSGAISTSGKTNLIQSVQVINLSSNATSQQIETIIGRQLNEDDCARIFPFTATTNTVTVDTPCSQAKDNVDDHGIIVNAPSLDITTNELCIAKTFRIGLGEVSKWLFSKADTSEATTQYGLKYNATNGNIELWLEGVIRATTNMYSISQNVLYNVVFYKNSAGVIDSYINKVKDVWYRGIGYTNLAINGNFVDASTWYASNSTIAASGNTMTVTGDGNNVTVRMGESLGFKPVTGNKFHYSAKMRVTNASADLIRIIMRDGGGGTALTSVNVATPIQNQWYRVSGILTVAYPLVNDMNILIDAAYTSGAVALGKVMEVKEVQVINITNIVPSTLTAAEYDAIFPFVLSTGTSGNRTVPVPVPFTSRANIRLGARSTNAGGTTHTDYVKEEIGSVSIYTGTSLNIAQILKAEFNTAKEYGLTQDNVWNDALTWDDTPTWDDTKTWIDTGSILG